MPGTTFFPLSIKIFRFFTKPESSETGLEQEDLSPEDSQALEEASFAKERVEISHSCYHCIHTTKAMKELERQSDKIDFLEETLRTQTEMLQSQRDKKEQLSLESQNEDVENMFIKESDAESNQNGTNQY